MSCSCAACLSCCFTCCNPEGTATPDKYPHINYKSLQEASVLTEVPEVAPDKVISCSCAGCLSCCSTCCNPESKKYKSPASVMTEVLQATPDKVFKFPQYASKFPVHPQISTSVITEEPKAQRKNPRGVFLKGSETLKFPMGKVASAIPRCYTEPSCMRRSSSPIISSDSKSTPHPSLQFSLYHDIQHGSITVHLHKAYNLQPKGQDHTCNPFVEMYMLPNKEEVFKSTVIEKNLNPEFDQIFHFRGIHTDHLLEQTLILRVFDRVRLFQNAFIGGVAVSLREADLLGVAVRKKIDGKAEHWQACSCCGDIFFSLMYDDRNACIQGVIHKSTNLHKMDVWGWADPYVKVNLLHKGKRSMKWKTSIRKNTATPVFNESFQFDISELDIQDISLEFVMMDYDRFSRDEVVGVVQVGAHAPMEKGWTHWQQMLSSPQQRISKWHPLIFPSKMKKLERSDSF